MTRSRLIHSLKILSGPLAAMLIMVFADLSPGNPMVTRMAALTAWMAIWWLSEVVHLAVTALIPIVFMPVLGIAEPKIVAFQYMDQIIFLFIGGFLISFAVERWGLHERIALKILMIVGTRNDSILMGVMITSFLISMWISNTATVMMLISAVMAIIYMTEQLGGASKHQNDFAKALLIGLAYSATIGGMATLVGTPPNMVFMRSYMEAYPNNNDMTFTKWFSIGFPVAVLMLIVCFFVLKTLFIKQQRTEGLTKNYFKDAYTRLGAFSFEQKIVSVVFVLTAVLWFTRAEINFGFFTMPGWNSLFPFPEYIQDSTVAVFMALVLFNFPARSEKNTTILQWKDAAKLPFDIILLFGSGFALAKGFEVSGLSDWLAGQLKVFKGTNPIIMIASISLIVCIISEFASNVASIQLVIPVLIAFQKELDIPPLLLMVPATLAASLGFMLPVATAPNTIVFGSKKIAVGDMAKAGLLMDIFGIIIITLVVVLLQY
ncbi:MAG TPA: SLC13 family permease [Bacteroidia bacterium]|mgnify:CR=1 FL=1|nr:SLC13 family permease [Bacteroidia bacterium]